MSADPRDFKKTAQFEGLYIPWRESRIKKIISVMGENFFHDATGLELGCGYGHTGKELIERFSCDITFTDGNEIHREGFSKINPDRELMLLDQDNPWNLEKKFDFIIHWGVLYHLDNWQQDLECALTHTNVMFLETEVCDSLDPDFEIKVQEPKAVNDQAVNGKGTKPSPAFVEKILNKNGCKWTRYDDKDLNATMSNNPNKGHRYDWVVKNDKRWEHGLRRFWIIDNR